MFDKQLMQEIRSRFCHVDTCPYQGPRIYFENAGGSLTLKSVVEVNAELAAIPDNHGRDNPASQALSRIIEKGREDMRLFLGVTEGPVFVGESGTELIFRMVRAAALGAASGGSIVGSTLEHPATASAGKRWAEMTGREYRAASHDNESGTISAERYAEMLDEQTRIATIIHTSPITGIAVDIEAIVKVIRSISPDCIIILDGIQHAAHGSLFVDDYDVDGYAVSAYKVFSRHNYGFAWVSPRLATLPHDHLEGTAEDFWELGTRDTSAFACTTEVVNYLDWLGSQFTENQDRRARILEAGKAIGSHENSLINLLINGDEIDRGLRYFPSISIIGGSDNPVREGTVSFIVDGVRSEDVVSQLSDRGIRTHIRRADHYSGNILEPLGQGSCVRISLCHYNTFEEVRICLQAMATI